MSAPGSNQSEITGPVWCTAWSQQMGESPVGTAVAAERFVLVELPLPWPSEIERHPLLRDALGRDEPPRGVRIQALGCERGCGETHAVLCYWREAERPFSGFHCMRRQVERSALAERVSLWVQGVGLEADAGTPRRDVLLCTHGSRDRCCGKLGGRLFEELRRRAPADVHLWRTSHTGGHRFAPTGITFPDGMAWAGLDAELAAGIIEESVPVEVALRHLRGCAGVGAGVLQAADAQGLARCGWEWRRTARSVTLGEDDGTRASVAVTPADPELAPFTVVVERGRTLPIASCGQPIGASRKTATELLVRS